MNIEKALSVVSSDKTMVRLHLAHWVAGGNIKVITPTIEDDFQEQLKSIVEDQLNKCDGLTQSDYNVVGANDDTLETANFHKYEQRVNAVLDAIDVPNQKFRFANDNFDFFIYEFCYDDEDNNAKKVFAFRRTKKFKSFKKGFIGHFVEGHFKKIIENGLLGNDGLIDLIVYDEEIAILQHIAFERIFRLSNEFRELAEEVLKNDTFNKKIINFSELKEAALNNRSYIKRLSKLDSTNTATLFLKDLQKTKVVVDELNLDIDIDLKSNQMQYRDETQLGNFINLMQDAYYKTLIGNMPGLDERR
ncbi:DUF4868 domain-containing protein [Lactiplantibacillus pentosus]|jgi:hypothetical protein|uniref:DUF4868 domain-containing protein n=1 Tax=Lactiplantibacillus pentosus TaxID=1589 RepID=UPI0015977526|nr:DUF4868 domain-containing protein [Lactiplantibacillus pentosus]MCT3292680.1 DUF4868 domain-containing protein [Lactiplantibacillus pentosus]UXI96196.1 DUF4868 domain-containing protein [Lactiplantibacillus pentosus]BBM23180.1 prophage protein [Lactiplantibacillus plantarum]